jgi:hypothetical protein
MADKIFYGVQALQPELKILPGSFTLAGTSDPAVKAGAGFSVARSGTGKWTVTLTDAYPAILSVQVCFELDGDEAVFVGEEDDESSEYSYSDEQHEMAKELLGAVDAGNTQGILEAIHGISMSYD